MHIATPGTMDWGKLLLGLFRIGMVVALIWLIRHFMRKKAPKGVLIGFGLILAGAIGNIIDSAFYGLIFSASTPDTVAHFGGHYAGFMMGKVVDMFYFPLFQWNSVPPDVPTVNSTLLRSVVPPASELLPAPDELPASELLPHPVSIVATSAPVINTEIALLFTLFNVFIVMSPFYTMSSPPATINFNVCKEKNRRRAYFYKLHRLFQSN